MLTLRFSPLVRAVAVVSAVAVMVTGVTLAALNSQVTLTNNSISTATVGLKVWDGDSFESSLPGFTVTDLVPGTGKTFPLYFQNNSGAALNLTAHVPATPSNFGFTGLENVTVDITGENCSTTAHTTLAALIAGQVALPCNPLAAGAQGNAGASGTAGNYQVKFDILPAAITGDHASVGNFDLVLTGTQV